MTGLGGTSLGTKTVVPGIVLTSAAVGVLFVLKAFQTMEHFHIMVKGTYRT